MYYRIAAKNMHTCREETEKGANDSLRSEETDRYAMLMQMRNHSRSCCVKEDKEIA